MVNNVLGNESQGYNLTLESILNTNIQRKNIQKVSSTNRDMHMCYPHLTATVSVSHRVTMRFQNISFKHGNL